MVVPSLTTGAVSRILNGEDVTRPILQILGCKKIPAGTGNHDRYRVLISDGDVSCPFAMLGTQLNPMVENRELEKFTCICVEKCVCNQVQDNKKVIILLNLSVVASSTEVGTRIGNPVNYNPNAPPVPPPQVAASNSCVVKQEPFSVKQEPNSANMSMSNGSSVEQQIVHPISTLTPYQNKWGIKARLTSKTPLRQYSNSRGEGKVFSFNLLDESGEIRATGFNDQADKFYEMLEVNKVYYLSKGNLKPANTKFSNVKHEYEITLNNETIIIPSKESGAVIPMMKCDFIPIAQIEQQEKDANVDVIGVCKECGEANTFVARTSNKEMTKRDIRLVDQSGREVSLTLWGKEALEFNGDSNPVVAVKGARVSDFNGKSLSVSMSSTMTINPDIREAHILKGWFENEGKNMEMTSLSGAGMARSSALGGGEWKTFAQAVQEQLGNGDKADYYLNKATVVMVRKENCMYQACPTEECNKKVVDMNNGIYRCEKCGKEYPNFKWRLLLSLSLADFTDNQWVTCFQEAAETVLGLTAQQLGDLKQNSEDKFIQALTRANFASYCVKLRTKMETYNEESRLKTTAVTLTELNMVDYTKKLISDIKKMEPQLC